MKILILIQIFETHDDTGSDRHYYFAKKMIEEGHEVEVITANIDYKNAKKRFKKKSGTITKIVDGITIKYVPVYSNFRGSFFKRMIFFISYFFSSIYAAISSSKIKIIYSVSTPLTVGLLGLIISKLKKVPMVFEVTDVWPDAAIQTGVIKSRLIIKISKFIENICYKGSSKIICLSKGIQSNIVNKGVERNETILVPNGVDLKLFDETHKINNLENLTRREYNFGDDFIAMYLGAHGAYNSLFTIIEAAKDIKKFEKIKIVFVGDGDEKKKLQEYAQKNDLNNIIFIGTVKRRESIKLLKTADIFMLPNRKGSFFECNLPNKLFDYLVSAKPILVSGAGETSELILETGSGYVVDAEDANAFSSSILKLFNLSKDERNDMGNKGKEFVSSKFNREDQALLLTNLFYDLLNK